jgi:hypothetical protein
MYGIAEVALPQQEAPPFSEAPLAIPRSFHPGYGSRGSVGCCVRCGDFGHRGLHRSRWPLSGAYAVGECQEPDDDSYDDQDDYHPEDGE